MYKLALILLLLFSSFTNPPGLVKVIAISDGDTFTILHNNRKVRIRVDAIDAPEKGMPYGKNSKQYLSALCFGQPVELTVKDTDRYGRLVARVKLKDGRDVSTEMVKAGMAWHFKKYSKDQNLAALELRARKLKIGLWHDNKPIAPWEIRKLRRQGTSTKKMFTN